MNGLTCYDTPVNRFGSRLQCDIFFWLLLQPVCKKKIHLNKCGLQMKEERHNPDDEPHDPRWPVPCHLRILFHNYLF